MSPETDIAWAAGLFEGEGCIYLGRSGTGDKPILRLTTTDHDVLMRFREIVGCGSITCHKPDKVGRKPSWQCHIGKADEVLTVLNGFWPYLGDRRREKAMEAIERASKCGEHPNAPYRLRKWRAEREAVLL